MKKFKALTVDSTEKDEDEASFQFTGFTSTSCEREQATKFAYQNGELRRQSGQVPVLLVMDTEHYDGKHKAFLHDPGCCAFPEEKEYLLGAASWRVTKIAEETLEYRGRQF